MVKLNEHTQNNVDKVSRYGWSTLGPEGQFQRIDKRLLEIDKSYQRDADSEKKVLYIAGKFEWPSCAVLCVAYRNGRYWVLDGHHRLMAAMKRSDITLMPCMVFETTDAKEEAEIFLRINTHRKAMTGLQKFKALVKSENEAAIKANELISQSGRVVARNSGATVFSAPTVLIRCIEADEAAIRRIWPLIVQVCDGQPINNRIISGMFFIETRLEQSTSLTQPKWKRKVLGLGAAGLMDAINRACAFYENGGDRVYANGILSALNKNARAEKLSLRELGKK